MSSHFSQSSKKFVGILGRYFDAYCKQNWKVLQTLLAPNVVFVGVGFDEQVFGVNAVGELLRLHFEHGKCQSYDLQCSFVHATDVMAYVTGDVTLKIAQQGHDIIFTPRFTAVLEPIKSTWLLGHLHFSLPASSQRIGYPFPQQIT